MHESQKGWKHHEDNTPNVFEGSRSGHCDGCHEPSWTARGNANRRSCLCLTKRHYTIDERIDIQAPEEAPRYGHHRQSFTLYGFSGEDRRLSGPDAGYGYSRSQQGSDIRHAHCEAVGRFHGDAALLLSQ